MAPRTRSTRPARRRTTMVHVPKAQILIPLLMLSLLVASCAKRPSAATSSVPAPTVGAVATAPPPATGTVPSGPRAGMTSAPGTGGTTTPAPATPPRPAPREFVTIADLKDIHFDFDRYDIRPGDATVLDDNARWMKANATHLILIEGHADERGTNEYNLALGERRAKATMNYLVAQGIQASRITIISYGEERPLCAEKNEACWAKNRRAHFLVKAQ